MKTPEEKTKRLPKIEEHIVYWSDINKVRVGVTLAFESEEQMHEWLDDCHKQKMEEIRPKLHKLLYRYLSAEFDRGLHRNAFDANNSEMELPRIDLSVVPELKEAIKSLLTQEEK